MKGSALLCLTALGNPEPLYRNTRHNAGINILRLLKQKLCPNLQLKQSSISQHVEYCHDSEQNILILLNKSQYMNLSGHSMIPIWRKLPHDTMHVVIHDELNIPMGKVQLRKPGTSFRGHNGLRAVSYTHLDVYKRQVLGHGNAALLAPSPLT